MKTYLNCCETDGFAHISKLTDWISKTKKIYSRSYSRKSKKQKSSLKIFDKFESKFEKFEFSKDSRWSFSVWFLPLAKSVFGDSQNQKMNTSEPRRPSLKNGDSSALPPISGPRSSMMDFISDQDPRSSKKAKFEPNLPNLTRSDSIPRRRSTGKLFLLFLAR